MEDDPIRSYSIARRNKYQGKGLEGCFFNNRRLLRLEFFCVERLLSLSLV